MYSEKEKQEIKDLVAWHQLIKDNTDLFAKLMAVYYVCFSKVENDKVILRVQVYNPYQTFSVKKYPFLELLTVIEVDTEEDDDYTYIECYIKNKD